MTATPSALGSAWAPSASPGWQLRRVKDIARIVNGYPFDSRLFDAQQGYPLIRIRDLNSAETETRYNGEWIASAAVEAGDVLVGMDGEFNVGTWRGGRALLNQRMCCVRGETALVSRFLAYALPIPLKVINDLTYSTTVKHLSSLDIERITLAVPPQAELERVLRFLDEQTARIDALIAEKERLVGLLEQATWDEVTRAVTSGIKGAATRATGIDWCPAIPRHWDVVLLKRLFVRTEYGLSESMNSEGAVAVLRMGNVREGRVHLTDLKFVDSVPDGLLLEPRDLLYNRTNSLAQVGKVGMLRVFPEFPLTFASYLVRLVPNERALPEYLNYLLNCPDVLSIARSLALPAIGQANLNPTRYGYIYVPIPPASEQSAIVEHLDRRTTAIEQLSVHACEHISRLREYRSSLISAAVTGLIDSNTYNKNAGDSRVAA